MHHHEPRRCSFHAAAATSRCHEDSGAPPYFTSWFISHADMSPREYSLAPGYSPEYHTGCGSSESLDPHHHYHYGPANLISGPGSISVNGTTVSMHHHHAHPRTLKRRPTANRKERRRTQSINSAFAELRECIPNVPADTKLSKIKTLRLATSYISYLMDILDKDGQHGETQAFKAELKKTELREERRRRNAEEVPKSAISSSTSPQQQVIKRVRAGRGGLSTCGPWNSNSDYNTPLSPGGEVSCLFSCEPTLNLNVF